MLLATEKSVLIVEDHPESRAAMAAEAQRLGFVALMAHDYVSALSQLAKHDVLVISIHLELPRESGYELCEHIRGPLGLSHVRILVTSERDLVEGVAYAEEAGANAFLAKPFTMAQFGHCLRSLSSRVAATSATMRRLAL